MKKIEIHELENISAEGCWAYVAGVALIVAGGVTANPLLGYAGLGIGLSNAESCGDTVSSWF